VAAALGDDHASTGKENGIAYWSARIALGDPMPEMVKLLPKPGEFAV
jgi:hypothetical protein